MIKDFLIKQVLGFIGKKLDGYKTKIGGAGMVLVGITGLIGNIWPDQGLPQMDVTTAIGAISGGFIALGIGGKIEKNTAAVKATVPTPVELVSTAFDGRIARAFGDLKESPKDAGKS